MTIYAIAIFICLILSFASCSNNNKKKFVSSEVDLEKYISEEIQKLENENIDKIIPDQKFFIGNDSLKQFDLKDFVKTKRIFFWFSQNTCTPCIDRCVEIIKQTFPDYETNERIIFVSPDYPVRFRNNCHGKQLLTLGNKYFGIEIEKKIFHFFFVLNSKMQVESIHVVNKNYFLRTEEYLQKIMTLLCANSY